MPQKLHDQTGNRPDILQAAKEYIIALGNRLESTMVGCYNITYENFFKLIQTTIQAAQEVAKSSANYFSFQKTGNCINLTDNTKEIRTISKSGIQGGTTYILDVKKGQKIIHLFSGPYSTTHARIRLHTQQDWTASRDTSIILWYDSENDLWKVCGDVLSDLVADNTNIIAVAKQATGYNLSTTGTITGFDANSLLGCTVTNLGIAPIAILSNSYLEFSTGSMYGIKVYNADSELIHELACCENNADCPYLHDVVTGNRYLITGTKTVVTQDVYFKCEDNGYQYGTIDGYNIYVAYKNDKTKIYE